MQIPSLKTALSSIVILSSLTTLPASAASACKGISQSACDNSNSCYWVSGYKRADGASVKAHCRTKAKSSISKAADKKSSSTKTAAKKETKNLTNKTTSSAKQKATDTKKAASTKNTTKKIESSTKKSSS
ncbi:hypothetical protein Q4498_11505 [Neptunomonas phycophila]|uniref:hypothetical protein n=1 Tax=Neptunomonas phycophila TaxID=1572645 RepID=UPI0026E2CAAC|nr:hypothetical protein [Neptunomonas phycophila]MDO6468740.1 hypothetical protein [Neptunomonas phycophila]